MLVRVAALFVASTLVAQAQPPTRKPGLWEIRTSATVDGKAAPKLPDLSQLSPQVRDQVQQAMAKQGAGMGEGGAIKLCLTAEQAKREAVHAGRPGCDVKLGKATASSIAYSFSCNGPEGMMTGEGEAKFEGAEKYSGWTTLKREGGPRPLHVRSEFQAKWLSADCGDVKPVK